MTTKCRLEPMRFYVTDITQINGPCAHAKCIHGICQDMGNEYYCLCEDEWTGIDCEIHESGKY